MALQRSIVHCVGFSRCYDALQKSTEQQQQKKGRKNKVTEAPQQCQPKEDVDIIGGASRSTAAAFWESQRGRHHQLENMQQHNKTKPNSNETQPEGSKRKNVESQQQQHDSEVKPAEAPVDFGAGKSIVSSAVDKTKTCWKARSSHTKETFRQSKQGLVFGTAGGSNDSSSTPLAPATTECQQ